MYYGTHGAPPISLMRGRSRRIRPRHFRQRAGPRRTHDRGRRAVIRARRGGLVSGADQADRSAHSSGNRNQPGRARHRGRAGQAGRAAGRCTASRCSSKTTSIRPTACRPRRARWRWWLRPAPRDAALVTNAARGRRSDSGQDQPERVGQFPFHAFRQRMERARRADAQPVCARSQPVRFELRARARPCRRTCAPWRWARRRMARWFAPSSMNGIVGIKPTVGLISRRAASSRSRTARIPPDRWRAPCAMRPFCWARWPTGRTLTPDYTRVSRCARPARRAHRGGAQVLRDYRGCGPLDGRVRSRR